MPDSLQCPRCKKQLAVEAASSHLPWIAGSICMLGVGIALALALVWSKSGSGSNFLLNGRAIGVSTARTSPAKLDSSELEPARLVLFNAPPESQPEPAVPAPAESLPSAAPDVSGSNARPPRAGDF